MSDNTEEYNKVRKVIYDAIIDAAGLDDGDCFATQGFEDDCTTGDCFCTRTVDEAVEKIFDIYKDGEAS